MELKVLSVISIILGIVSIIDPKTALTNKIKNERKAKHIPSDILKKEKEIPYSLIKEKDKANYSKKEIKETRIMGVFMVLLGILFLKLAMLGII